MAELKYVDWDGLVYYDGKIKSYIADKAEDYLKMGGIISFDNLPDPSFQNLNYIYKITDEFVSNSDFEKPGYKYKSGTWVQVTDINNTAVYRYTIFNEETIGSTADLSNYYTKSEIEEIVQEAIDSINVPEVDLENYYTKEEVDKLIPETDTFVTEDKLEETLSEYVIESELDQYKQDVSEVESALEEKADKTELQGLASEEFVLKKIAEAELADKEADLEAYYTKSETEAKIKEAVDAIDIPEVPTKVSELENDAGYVTSADIQDVYYLNFTNYTSNQALTAKQSEFFNKLVDGVSVTGYIYDGDIDSNTYRLITHVRKHAYAAEQGWVVYLSTDNRHIASKNGIELSYLSVHVELNKPDTEWRFFDCEKIISDLIVNEQFVKDSIDAINIPETDLSNYYNKSETENLIAEAVKDIEHPTVDLDGYATEEWVNNQGFLKEHQDLSEYAKKTDIPSHEDFVTKDALEEVVQDVIALNKSTVKHRYEILTVPGLEITYRDDEIRLNTEHIELKQQDVGEGGESNAYYIGIRIYASENAHSVRQNITSAPGIQDGKEIVPFTDSDIDAYGRKYSNAWVKCAIYQNGKWTNYGLSSTPDKCLGYYYTVEWFNPDGNIIENDTIHIVFTNDSCHYSNISDAVSRRFIDVKSSINNIEQNYVTNQTLERNYVSNTYITENYTTTEQLEATYVTTEKVTEVVTQEVETVVTEQIETKVTEVIDKKIETGEIEVNADAINYDTWD